MVEELSALALPLVNRFFRENGHKGKARSNERVFVLREEGKILAALRACPRSSGYLLRSVWVSVPLRSRGLGSKLLQNTLAELGDGGCWCYAYAHLEGFYQNAGFRVMDSTQVPPEIAMPFDNYVSRGDKLILMGRC